MENNNQPQPLETVPTPVSNPVEPVVVAANPGDGVWISKEEYNRLNNLTLQQPSHTGYPIGSGPNPSFVPPAETVQRGNLKDFWTYASAGIAILVFIMLTFGGNTWLTTPAILGVIVFAVLAVVSLVKPKRSPYAIQPSASNPYPVATPSNAGKVVGFVIGGVVLAAIAPFALMILFFILLASSGASSGS